MTTIRFAICGFGHIGSRHSVVISGYETAELSAIIDIDSNVQSHAFYPAGVPFYSSLRDFLDAKIELDVIVIATPTGLHTSQALEALRHNYHVLVEKPLGLTKVACEALVHESLTVNKNVFVVKQNRYSPPSKWLKQLVLDQTLGNINMVQINCYWNRDHRYYKQGGWKGTSELDGGVLFTQFSHFIDIMYWVFGDVQNVKTNLQNFTHNDSTEFVDSGNSVFEFVNGGLGSINFSTSIWDKNMESSITVIGSKGSLKIGGQYMNEVEYCHIENYDLPELPPTNPPNDYGPFKGSAANHHYVIENVVNTLNGNDTITANAMDGMKVVDIIERIYDAGK